MVTSAVTSSTSTRRVETYAVEETESSKVDSVVSSYHSIASRGANADDVRDDVMSDEEDESLSISLPSETGADQDMLKKRILKILSTDEDEDDRDSGDQRRIIR